MNKKKIFIIYGEREEGRGKEIHGDRVREDGRERKKEREGGMEEREREKEGGGERDTRIGSERVGGREGRNLLKRYMLCSAFYRKKKEIKVLKKLKRDRSIIIY